MLRRGAAAAGRLLARQAARGELSAGGQSGPCSCSSASSSSSGLRLTSAPTTSAAWSLLFARGAKRARDLKAGWVVRRPDPKAPGGEALLEVVKATYGQGQGRGSSQMVIELRDLRKGGKVCAAHTSRARRRRRRR
jgi:hypothetical protein